MSFPFSWTFHANKRLMWKCVDSWYPVTQSILSKILIICISKPTHVLTYTVTNQFHRSLYFNRKSKTEFHQMINCMLEKHFLSLYALTLILKSEQFLWQEVYKLIRVPVTHQRTWFGCNQDDLAENLWCRLRIYIPSILLSSLIPSLEYAAFQQMKYIIFREVFTADLLLFNSSAPGLWQ